MDGSLVLARAKGGRMGRLVFVFLFLLFPLSTFAQSGSLEERLAGLVEKAAPSVVKVKSEAGSPEGGKTTARHSTLALGIAIDASHVVTTADIEQLKYFSIISTPESVLQANEAKGGLKFTVQTADGRELEAKLVATDRTDNIAILSVAEGNLVPAPFGSVAGLKTGSLVIVPASCLSKATSASFGPVAELRRDGRLLLNVSVFPGMVGAPVLNQDGDVVGMITGQVRQSVALHTFPKNNDAQTVGGMPQAVDVPFSGQAVALTSSQLQKTASQLIQYQKVARPFIGVYPQNLDEELKAYHKVDHGVLITDVSDGGPAEIAGLKQGDVILSIDGQKMETERQFREFLGEHQPGDIIKVEVLRSNRKRNFKVTLGDRSEFEPAAPAPPPQGFRTPSAPKPLTPAYPAEGFLGVSIGDLSEEQKEEHDLDGGAYVEDVTEGTPAEKAGIADGDIITAFDGKPVVDGDDLYQKIRKSEPGKKVPIEVLRRGERQTLTVTLSERGESSPGTWGGFPERERMRIFRFDSKSGFLGVSTERLSRRAKDSLDLDGGVQVAAVTPESPADKAGLKEGDIITAVDGQKVFGPDDLSEVIGEKESGTEVKIEYLRKGKRRTAQAELVGRSGMERFFGDSPRMDFHPMPGGDSRDRQIDELEKQIEELRKSLDSLRREKE
ncbi:MAG: PDZ domain-containing protein [Candidatus Zixiibacteriota bacterium]